MFCFENDNIWLSKEGSAGENLHHIGNTLTQTSILSDNIENINLEALSDRIRNLWKRFSDYWLKCNRTKTKLMKKYSDWLNVVEHIDEQRSILLHIVSSR